MYLRFRLAALIVLGLSFASLSVAAEPLTTESILDGWERASHETKVIDARFTRLAIDQDFSTQETESGRFYYESADQWSYQVSNRCQFVRAADLLIVDRCSRTYRHVSHAEHAAASRFVREYPSLPACQKLWNFGNLLLWAPASENLDSLLPLSTAITAEDVARRYEITWSEADGRITLAAVPRPAAGGEIKEIGVILDRRSFAVLAHRVIYDSRQEVVHIFDSPVLNVTAADRDKLFVPDLSGLVDISLKEQPVGGAEK